MLKASPHDTKKPVGIWIRVSTEDQARGDSPEHHEHRARCYAESKGWEVIEVYHLEGVSGKNVIDHAETRRMLRDVKSGRVRGLIFSKLARLARNTKQLLEFADTFKEYDADLISLQESIDTSTPAGRLFYTMIAAMAQWEREEIAERVAASVPIRAKLGKSLGGQAPFGYQWKDKKLILNPEEAPIRRKVHELFREHRRKKTVARLLNEAGYRTRGGRKFSDTTVRRLISDPVAKGLRRANYTQNPNGTKRWGYKPEDEWVYSEVEAVVPVELWDECKALLDEQDKRRKKPAEKTVHLFAGLLYCDPCGKRMYVFSGSRNYTCPDCRKKIAIEDLEHIFVEQLKGFLLSPIEVEQYLSEAHGTLREREEAVSRLQNDLAETRRLVDELFTLYHDGQLPADGFRERYTPVYNRQKELEREVAEAEAACDLLKVDSLSSEHIFAEGNRFADHWPTLTADQKRCVIEDMVSEITVGKEEVSIELLYFPSHSSKNGTKGQRNESDSSRRRA